MDQEILSQKDEYNKLIEETDKRIAQEQKKYLASWELGT
jgi:hypothetical protein